MILEKSSNYDHLILDACCVINIYASGRMDKIIRSIAEQVVVTVYVQMEEALTIYQESKQKAPTEKEEINLEPFIDDQLLITVDLENDEEKMIFSQLVAARLDDGEAMTVAIGANRNWAIATDDHRARKICREKFPEVHLISTPELLHQWMTVTKPTANELSKTLIAIEQKANFLIGRNHHLYEWWEKMKEVE